MKDKILIVDDAELNRDILTEILEEDYTIIEAEDGKSALSIMEKQHSELAVVLLDLMMPEVDGFQVLEVMREKKWMDKLPVLIISGETAIKAEQKCFEYGVADVYDALVSERVYKSAYSKDEAFHMIVTGECGVFSPKLLECFRNVKSEFEALADKQK